MACINATDPTRSVFDISELMGSQGLSLKVSDRISVRRQRRPDQLLDVRFVHTCQRSLTVGARCPASGACTLRLVSVLG